MDAGRRSALQRALLAQLGSANYSALSLERALQESGVARAEFDAEFEGVDECLIAAYGELSQSILERCRSGCVAEQAWPERVRAGLATVLEAIAAQPEIAKVMTRGFPGVRPSFYVHYVDFVALFLPYMREGREFSGIEDELPAEVELLAVGAAESIIFGELEAGRAEELPSLLPEILFSVLVPFIGPDRAADEMKSASAAL
jgi:hypothetical protein